MIRSLLEAVRRFTRRRRLRGEIERLRREGPPRDLARALRSLGELERWPPSRDAGRGPYENAICILRELDQPLELAHAVRHLGDVHHDAGRPGLAEECYVEALELYRRHGASEPLNVANAMRSMAVLKEEQCARAEAASLWRDAHALYTQVRVQAGVDECTEHLAGLESSA